VDFFVNKFESIQCFCGFDIKIGNNPPIRASATGMILSMDTDVCGGNTRAESGEIKVS